MVNKAIIEEVITPYKVKVRIPQYHQIKGSPNATPTEDLPEAAISCPPGIIPAYRIGDVVYVDYELDQLDKPVITGSLSREDIPSTSDLSVRSVVINNSLDGPNLNGVDESLINRLKECEDKVSSGKFISYDIDQRSIITKAGHELAVDNAFGAPHTITTPFLSRTSTGHYLAKVKNAQGNSVAKQQLFCGPSKRNVTVSGVTITSGDGYVTVNGTATVSSTYWNDTFVTISGHYYYCGASKVGLRWNPTGAYVPVESTPIAQSSGAAMYVGPAVTSGVTYSNVRIDACIVDLTLAFGAGNEPTTLDALKTKWLQKYGTELPEYGGYNAGVLADTTITGLGSKGKNLFDPATQVSTRMAVDDNKWKNTATDTRALQFRVYASLLDGTFSSAIASRDTSAGTFSGTYTATQPFRLFIKHNGQNVGLVVSEAYSGPTYPVGTYTISGNITGAATGTIGGFIVENIQVERASAATTFETYKPYLRPLNITLRSAGNVRDELQDLGSCYRIIRRVGTVDLGSLTYTYNSTYSAFISSSLSIRNTCDLTCGKYTTNKSSGSTMTDKSVSSYWAWWSSYSHIIIKDTAYTDASTFKLAMKGVYLDYELVTPTIEYHSYNLTYPTEESGTEYWVAPAAVPCTVEYGINGINDIVRSNIELTGETLVEEEAQIRAAADTILQSEVTDLDARIEAIREVYTNPNLLDNPYFRIHQRTPGGTITGGSTIGTALYGPDRWKVFGGSGMTTASSYPYIPTLSAGATLVQMRSDTSDIFSPYYGSIPSTAVTLSALVSSGTALNLGLTDGGVGTYDPTTVTVTPTAVRAGLFLAKYTFTVRYGVASVSISRTGSPVTVYGMKLEIGSNSTIVGERYSDLAAELEKCQRYYYRISSNKFRESGGVNVTGMVGQGLVYANTTSPARTISAIEVKYPTTMYTNSSKYPTVSYSALSHLVIMQPISGS